MHLNPSDFYRHMASLTEWAERRFHEQQQELLLTNRKVTDMGVTLGQALGEIQSAVHDLMGAWTAERQANQDRLAAVAAGDLDASDAKAQMDSAAGVLDGLAATIEQALQGAAAQVPQPAPVGAVPNVPVASPAPIAPASPAGGTVTSPDGSSPTAANDTGPAGVPSIPSTADAPGTQSTPGNPVSGAGATVSSTDPGVDGASSTSTPVTDQPVAAPEEGTVAPAPVTPESPAPAPEVVSTPAPDAPSSSSGSSSS